MQNGHHWREQLLEIHDSLVSGVEEPSAEYQMLHSLIRHLPHEPLLVFNPDVTVASAYHQMYEYGVNFSLIQESQDTLLGVLDRGELEALLESASGKSSELAVSAVMGRNICIEPDTATLLEVMDRITMGACPCTIIVDSAGCPRSIVTPQSLIRILVSDGQGVDEVGLRTGSNGSMNASSNALAAALNKVA